MANGWLKCDLESAIEGASMIATSVDMLLCKHCPTIQHSEYDWLNLIAQRLIKICSELLSKLGSEKKTYYFMQKKYTVFIGDTSFFNANSSRRWSNDDYLSNVAGHSKDLHQIHHIAFNSLASKSNKISQGTIQESEEQCWYITQNLLKCFMVWYSCLNFCEG